MPSQDSQVVPIVEPPDASWRWRTPAEERDYYRRYGERAVYRLRQQVRKGIGRSGKPLRPVKPSSRPDGARGKPLDPHYAESRTWKYLRFSVSNKGRRIVLWWSHGWNTILGYHRRGEGHLPVRDVGLSDGQARALAREMLVYWRSKHPLAVAPPKAQPRPAPRPAVPLPPLNPAIPAAARPLARRYPQIAEYLVPPNRRQQRRP